jgi:hypothetical protein
MYLFNSNAAPVAKDVSDLLGTWECSNKDKSVILGYESEDEFNVMLTNPYVYEFSCEQIQRISHVLSIYRSLDKHLSDLSHVIAWLNLPDSIPEIGKKTAINAMKGGSKLDLSFVSTYLELAFLRKNCSCKYCNSRPL